MRLAIEALQREIWWVLTAWEQVVRERDRLSDEVTRGVRAGWAVQAAAQILQPRVRLLSLLGPVEMAGYPNLDDDESYRYRTIERAELPGWRGVLDMIRLHRRAFAMQGLNAAAPEAIDGIPCKNIECDQKDLYRELGDDGVFCGSCGKRYSQKEFDDWAALVRGHQRCPTCNGKISDVGPPDENWWATIKPCGHRMPITPKVKKKGRAA